MKVLSITFCSLLLIMGLAAGCGSDNPSVQNGDESSDSIWLDVASGADQHQTGDDTGVNPGEDHSGHVDSGNVGSDDGTPADSEVTHDLPVGTDLSVADVEQRDWAGYDITYIHLQGTSITVDGPGATAAGTKVTIARAGVYQIDGTLNDGQIRVDTTDVDDVELLLNGIDVTCSNSAPLFVVASEKVKIYLLEGTQNKLADGATYVFETAGDTEPNAALFSKADLKIDGVGSLTVDGNYNDGIASKDSLGIKGGTIVVSAKDDGLRGKDEITVSGGNITITSAGDGLSSDNTEDTAKGFISIEGGTLNVSAAGDGLAAETTVTVTAGDLAIKTGGGSGYTVASTASAKGIKGVTGVTITGGTIDLNSADDCVHSNGAVSITGGTMTLSSADDAVHSDTTLTVDGGDITVTKSYEGLEATTITVNDGTIHITSSDDGINVAGGDGSGGFNPGGSASSYFLYINGGYIWMDANGDGLDSNGNIIMTGGTVLVNGPTRNDNGAVDFGDGGSYYFKMTGGFLVAAGSSGMAVGPGTSSTQYSVLINFTSQQAGSIFHLQNSAGTDMLTFVPTKTYQSVVFSSPELAKGTYEVYFGGKSTGTLVDGLYTDGTYTPGTKNTSFTISSITTKVGSGGGPGW